MAIPSIDGVGTTNIYQNWMNPYATGLYSPHAIDMETATATGFNPSSSLNPGYDYGLFNSLGYASPYNLGYDSFSYANPMGMGYGMYGMTPAMTQAMVQSQAMMLDGQRVINGKQRDMRYDGQIKELQYQTVLKDAQDTTHEDQVRRDTNFKAACDKINERLEAKDTAAALKEYDYAVALMAKVYDDVDLKRLDETPSGRAAIKAAFERKYQEVYGHSFKDKIDQCLSGGFGSGFDTAWKRQHVMSAEEVKAVVDDRNVSFKAQEGAYRTLGSITGGIANTAVITGAGAAAGSGIGALVGGCMKDAAGKRMFKAGAGKGAIAAAVATFLYSIYSYCTQKS